MPATIGLRLPNGSRVIVHCFPRTAPLEDDVRRAWPTEQDLNASTDDYRRDLEADLRRWYSRLVIQSQTSEGALSGADATWYIFRDGRIRADDEPLNRLHSAMHQARRTTDETEEAMRGARAAMDEASRPRPRKPAMTGASRP